MGWDNGIGLIFPIEVAPDCLVHDLGNEIAEIKVSQTRTNRRFNLF